MLSSIRRFIPALLIALVPLTVPGRSNAQATAGAPRAQTTASASATAKVDPAKAAAIHELLTMSKAVDLALLGMETSIPAQRASNPAIPAVFWDRFMTQVKSRRGELEDLMTAVYDRHFSTDELRQLVAFYKTPIGQKLLQLQPTILQESMIAGQQWGQRIGMEVGQQLAAEGVKVP